MARSSTTITGGLGLCQLLTVLFATLKLYGNKLANAIEGSAEKE